MDWDGLERRKFVRGDVPFKVFIYLPGGKIIAAYTDDISRMGARIVIEEKLDVSKIFDLEIYLEDEPTKCKGKIIWVQERQSSDKNRTLYYTGIKFM